ncbi:aldo/keto reductase family oxidoreductase [Bacillus salitolerans]|uniref:Aldo/keto reductase family oxidoreductase n=1 Tax=Bacillus salitolerans TaxID=1437434 RepID=A0ABW4LQ18_9BACI
MSVTKDIILGCMGFGGGWNQNPISNEDEKKAQAAIEAALEVGMKRFDHADIYTLGKAEEVFGRVLKSKREMRENMIIQTKAGIILNKGPNGSSIYNNSKDYLINQVYMSLKRLQIEYIDTFLIHRPDPLMNGEEIAETFHYLKEQGFVRNFGVSNMSLSQVQYIQQYWKDPLVANQIQLSLGHSTLLDTGVNVNTKNMDYESGVQGLFEYCKSTNMVIQAWGSLDQGRFLRSIEHDQSEQEKLTASLIQELAEKYNTGSSTIALAWLLVLPVSIHPIIGTINPSRIRECYKALSIQLTREEWYQLWILARGVSLP